MNLAQKLDQVLKLKEAAGAADPGNRKSVSAGKTAAESCRTAGEPVGNTGGLLRNMGDIG